MSAPSPTRVVRSALEDALDTRLASTVLFEALGEAGSQVPRSLDELVDVVRGPLREVLARRLDPGQAADLVEAIERALMPPPDEPATLEIPLDELVPRTERDDMTAPVLRLRGPVPVLVVAETDGFARRLLAALGDNRVAPSATPAPSDETLEDPPRLLIVDASDFPTAIGPRALLSWAAGLPPSTALVLWAASLPYGKNLQRELASTELSFVTFDPTEGIAPLLDLIRSRGRAPT